MNKIKAYSYSKRVGERLERIQHDIKDVSKALGMLQQKIDRLFLDVIAKEMNKEEKNGSKKR
jgi:hypothetical protein